MVRIQKNLSDEAMFAGYKEERPTGEAAWAVEEEKARPTGKSKQTKEDFNRSFLTPELEEQIGKALLQLKMELYKEGIVDYQVKVKRDGRQIILTASPNPRAGKIKEAKL